MITDVEVTHMDTQPSGVRPDTSGKASVRCNSFQIHFPALPVTIDCPFQPAQGPWTSEESTARFTPTPQFYPPDPFFRVPAHVSFIRHVCGFQGLSERLLFFSTSAMDECFSYLFIALCCSLLLLYPFLYPPPSQINFCHSERRADKGKSITVT